jgi:FlaA1/EpsC-like NDP-sugar epimerase
MGKRIMVIGGSGMIGHELINQLKVGMLAMPIPRT